MKNRILNIRDAGARFARVICLAGIVLAIAAGAMPSSAQSGTRPRPLNEQLLRARNAFVSGSSLLEAKTRVDRVVEELPADAEARVLRAEILIRMGRFEEAALDAGEATRLEPSNGKAHLALAESSFQKGDTATTERSINRASQLLVDDAAAHVRLSRLARALNRPEKAVAFARIAVALEPNNAACHYELARAFVANANVDAAASVLASGLRGGLLSEDFVSADSLLQPLAQHRDVKPYVQ